MARVAGIAVLAVLAVAPTASEEARFRPVLTAPPSPLLGVTRNDGRGTSHLVAVDPRSLRPLAGRGLVLFGSVGSWAYSPDGTRLALAGSCQVGRGLSAGIVLVDVLRLRPTGCLWVGGVTALLWPEPRRLLAVAPDEVLFIDPARGTVVRRTPLPFGEQRIDTARTGDRIVFLDASGGLARLVVVDAQGAVRSMGIDVPAGAQPRSATFARPSLAVDPAGARAFVVAASGSVAEISLDAMTVEYRELREPVSLLGRLARWLEPVAEAKEFHPGATPTAVWLGHGKLALAGTATSEGTSRPSGLTLVDTRTWLRETLDPDVSRVTVSDGRLIALGPRAGIRLFDLAGRSLYRRFDGRDVQLHLTYRGRIAATVGFERRVRMISVESGKTTEMRAEAPPRLLVGTSG